MSRIVLSENKIGIGHHLSKQDALILLEKSMENPLFFAENILNAKLWSKQRSVMKALWNYPRVAVKSGHAVGKSYLAAVCALTFVHTHYPSIVITTAPVARQVQHVIWKEISKLYHQARIPLGGELLSMTYRLDENAFIIGIATDDPEKIQGFHSENILVIVDEAAGIDDPIMESIESILAGGNTRLLMLGNPSRLEGHFYRAFTDKVESQIYKKFTISALETPNVVQGKVVIPGLVTREWVEQRRKIWGPDHPLYRIRVLGEFPQQQFSDLVIPPFLLDIARENEIPVRISSSLYTYNTTTRYNTTTSKTNTQYPNSNIQIPDSKVLVSKYQNPSPYFPTRRKHYNSVLNNHPSANIPNSNVPTSLTNNDIQDIYTYYRQKRTGEWAVSYMAVANKYILGIDVGEYGESETAVAVRLGPKLLNVYAWSQGELAIQVNKVLEIIQIYSKSNVPIEIRIDSVGVGYGLYEVLKDYATKTRGRITVYGIDVRERPIHPEIYYDTRSEMWMEFRNLLANKEVDMTEFDRAGFEPEQVYAQLTTPRYFAEETGRIRIETAKNLRMRGAKRLDRATAVVLAFYDTYMERSRTLTPPNPVYYEGITRLGREEEAPWRTGLF